MNGLILHCGSQLTPRNEVFAVPTPEALYDVLADACGLPTVTAQTSEEVAVAA